METFTDDTVVALASFLSPNDMLSLALTCKRFGDKNGTTTSRSRRVAAREARKSGGNREVRQKTESISLMEVAARTILHTKWTDEENNALPRRGEESWIGIYHEFLKLFRLPLQFDKLAGQYINYVDDIDKTRVHSNTSDMLMNGSTAICTNIMRAGKHSVSFQANHNEGIRCGIMRPTTKDITSLRNCHPACDDLSSFSLKEYEILNRSSIDCCLLDTCMGHGLIRIRWKKWEESKLMVMDDGHREQAVRENRCRPFDWEGIEEIRETSFKIGFVLDLDEGTLDVYKNDRRIGTLMRGLVGEYCWVVTLFSSLVPVTIGR